GQEVGSEELGGAAMHAEISGTVDFREPDDHAALARLRRLAATYAPQPVAPWAVARIAVEQPAENQSDLVGVIPSDGGSRPYEIKEVLARILDASLFDEYKADYGATLV